MSKNLEEQAETLKSILGDDSTEKLLKLCGNYDKYVKKYKEAVNEILAPYNYSVLLAHSFVDDETREKILEGKLNGNTD